MVVGRLQVLHQAVQPSLTFCQKGISDAEAAERLNHLCKSNGMLKRGTEKVSCVPILITPGPEILDLRTKGVRDDVPGKLQEPELRSWGSLQLRLWELLRLQKWQQRPPEEAACWPLQYS